MANGFSPLPAWLVEPRITPRVWLAIAGGLGCAVVAHAGLYPQFDSGRLRLVLALTSGPFGAAVMATALNAKTATRAFLRTVVLAAILGVASTVVPAILLSSSDGSELGVLAIVGVLFGAPTGLMYGLPLGVLTAAGHAHVPEPTHLGNDRASRLAGAWLATAGLFAMGGALAFDQPLAGILTAASAALAGLVVLVRGEAALRQKNAWLERVRSGREPALRVRPLERGDAVDGLVRLGAGSTVVEWCPAVPETTAYRQHRVRGTAIAVIAD